MKLYQALSSAIRTGFRAAVDQFKRIRRVQRERLDPWVPF